MTSCPSALPASPPDAAAAWLLLREVARFTRGDAPLAVTLQTVLSLLASALGAASSSALQVVAMDADSVHLAPYGRPAAGRRTTGHDDEPTLGRAALERRLLLVPGAPDVSLLDVVLPVVDGVRTVALLRWQGVPPAHDRALLAGLFETVQVQLDLLAERERLKTARDAASEHEFLHELMENLPVGLFVYDAVELRVLSVNSHAEKEFALRREAITGKTLEEAFGSAVSELGLPLVAQALARQGSVEHDFDMDTREGLRSIHVRHVALRHADGSPRFLVALARDVTKERAAERDLQESEARFREFAESMDDVLFVTNPERDSFHFLSPNRCTRQWGGTPEALLETSQAFLAAVHPQDRPQLAERSEAEKRLEATDISYRVQHPALGERWVRTRTRSRRTGSGEVCVYGIVSDVTSERQRQLDLQHARDAAEAASQAKSQFMANMSHEIRTPMNGILGMTELLLATPLSDKQRRFVQAVYRSGEALLEIIDDVLDFSKVEAGRLDLAHVDFSLRGVVEDSLEMLAPRAHEKGLELSFREAPGLPALVNGDPMRLRQVLSNLVANAIKFTEQGEVAVELALTPAGEGAAAVFQFQVRDTGIGIEADMLPQLFKAFMQASAGMSRRFGGTGLGLTIAKQLVELMGGSIRVDSRLGMGSRFTVELPLAPCGAGPGPEAADTAAMPPLRVLLVDDHPTSRSVLDDMLRGWGLQVTPAGDGRQALDILQGRTGIDPRFDLALIDTCMPHLDGLGLARVLQTTGLYPGLKLILLSSLATPDGVRAAHEAGFGRFVPKPVRKAELRQAILGISAAHSDTPQLTTALNAHILVVEDNVINQEVIGQMLRSLGCRVRVSPGGLAGLRALCDKHFDLVLMDIQMPGMDGVEVLQRFRQAKTGRFSFVTPTDTPVIAVTANALEGDAQRFLGLGFDGYLSKPFRQSQLLAMLTQHLQLSAPTEPRQAGAGSSGLAPLAVAASSTAATGLDVLDAGALERLRELDPNNENRLMERVVNAFETSVGRLMPQLQDALLANELAGIRHVSHTLKSSSASIGAVKLSKMCSEIESMARQNQSDGMTERVVLLQAEVEIVRVALQRMLNT